MATATQTIREIVASEPAAAAVLERFEIDLCSQAAESLEHACAELQLCVDQVLEKLARVESVDGSPALLDPARVPLSRLMQHIVRTHHQYERQELPRLSQIAQKVAAKHGAREPVFKEIAARVEDLRVDMLNHLQKEEQVLFPYVAQMDQQWLLAYMPPQSSFRTVAQPVLIMAQEHETATHILKELEALTNGFTPAPDACGTRIALMGGLRRLKTDVDEHMRLESEFLFKRAVELEAELSSRVSA